MREGTFQFNNEAGITLNVGTLNADPGANKNVVVLNVQVNLTNAGDVFDIKGNFDGSGASVKNTAGSFILESGVLASFTGTVDKEVDGPSVLQAGGGTYLYLGSILSLGETTQALLMTGGVLSIRLDAGDGPAEIVGHVKITGGDIISSANTSGDTHLFGELKIEGNLHWIGGTYRPFVSAESADNSDTLYVTGIITIEGTAAIAPGAVDGENNAVLPPANMVWDSLLSDSGINDPGNVLSVLSGWALNKLNNKSWQVKGA
jgi:hypothetical protein